jgi:hypothetical protein
VKDSNVAEAGKECVTISRSKKGRKPKFAMRPRTEPSVELAVNRVDGKRREGQEGNKGESHIL